MRLILIRHGSTAANEKRLYCGSTDIGLSDAGIKEFIRLREKRSYPDITGMDVVTSGMKRCEQTLTLLYGDIPHRTDPDFREIDFGAFEMRSYDELKDEPDYIAWITGDNEANITPGGESGEMMKQRALRGLERIIAADRDTLLITHGGVIAALMAYLFPNKDKSRYDWQPEAGRGYIIDTDKRDYRYIRI